MTSFVHNNEVLDEFDEKIVRLLLRDGRLSVPAIAEQVGISRAAAYKRFDRLIDSGVIKGFTARVEPVALGLNVASLVLITAEQGQWANVQQRLLNIEGVHWIGLAAGNFDYAVLLRASDLAELRDVVLRQLQDVEGVATTQTAVLLGEARSNNAVL